MLSLKTTDEHHNIENTAENPGDTKTTENVENIHKPTETKESSFRTKNFFDPISRSNSRKLYTSISPMMSSPVSVNTK